MTKTGTSVRPTAVCFPVLAALALNRYPRSTSLEAETNIVKTRAKRPARKSPSKLQGARRAARERWQAAKKSAKRAKQAAKQARRQFKDAKKIVKRAKAEMLAAARKLQSSVMSAARRKKSRASRRHHQSRPATPKARVKKPHRSPEGRLQTVAAFAAGEPVQPKSPDAAARDDSSRSMAMCQLL